MQDLELVNVNCPYCGEPIDLSIDTSVEQQQYVEDCQVCCRPMLVTVSVDGATDEPVNVVVQPEND